MSTRSPAISFSCSSAPTPRILAAIASLALSFAASPAQATTPAVLVVLEKPALIPASVRGDILAAVTEGISLAGAVPRTTPRNQPSNTCATESCFAELAAQHNVAYVLVLKARGTRDSYHLAATIYEGKSGTLTSSSEKDCVLCSAPDFVASVRATVASLCQQVMPATPEPAPAALSARPETNPIANPPPTEEERPWSVPRYLSLTALVGGAVMIGAGGYLLHIDGKGTCDLVPPQEHCPKKYRTQGLGIGLVAGGSLAALGGLVGLVFFSPQVGDTNLALGFGASSFSSSGAF
jgi:hypothetical protein